MLTWIISKYYRCDVSHLFQTCFWIPRMFFGLLAPLHCLLISSVINFQEIFQKHWILKSWCTLNFSCGEILFLSMFDNHLFSTKKRRWTPSQSLKCNLKYRHFLHWSYLVKALLRTWNCANDFNSIVFFVSQSFCHLKVNYCAKKDDL